MKRYQGIALSLLVSVLVLAVLIWLSPGRLKGNQYANISPSGSVLEAEQAFFDFGNISMAAGDVSHNFKIKNTGSEPVTITKIYTSCMCTKATLIRGDGGKIGPFGMLGHGVIPSIRDILQPGEEAKIEAIFYPAAHGPAGLGSVERVITMENNGKSNLDVSFRANVAP